MAETKEKLDKIWATARMLYLEKTEDPSNVFVAKSKIVPE